MPGHALRHSAMSCAETAELIKMPLELWTRVGPGGEACVTWGCTFVQPGEYESTDHLLCCVFREKPLHLHVQGPNQESVDSKWLAGTLI